MSGVSRRPERDGARHRAGFWARAFLAAVIVSAGPGFFSYALYDALYKDLSKKGKVFSANVGAVGRSALPSPAAGDREQPAHRAKTDSAGPPAKVWSFVRRAHGGIGPDTSSAKAQNPPSDSANARFAAYLALRRKTVQNIAEERTVRLERASAEGSKRKRTVTPGRRYRTVCVRLCDGYFFPVGVVSGPFGVQRQAAKCASSCGAPARLFLYPEKRGSPADMFDLSGRPYLSLKNAFRYQAEVDARCTCRPQPWSLASRLRHRRYATAEQTATGRQLPPAVIAAATTPSNHARPGAVRQIRSRDRATPVAPVSGERIKVEVTAVPPSPARLASVALNVSAEHRAPLVRSVIVPAAVTDVVNFAARVERTQFLASLPIKFSPVAARQGYSRFSERAGRGRRASGRMKRSRAHTVSRQPPPYVVKPYVAKRGSEVPRRPRYLYAERKWSVADFIHRNLYRQY